MSEICWFCKKNPQDPTKSIEVPLYKILDTRDEYLYKGLVKKQIYATNTLYEYHPVRIQVPRCTQCAKNHAKGNRDDQVRVISGLVVLFIVLVATIVWLILSHNPAWWLFGIIVAGICLWLANVWGKYSGQKRMDYIKSLGIKFDTSYYDYPEYQKLINAGYKEGLSPTDKHHR